MLIRLRITCNTTKQELCILWNICQFKDFMLNNILPEYQKYLIFNKLVPEKNVPFYALWVSKFLSFSNRNEGFTVDIRMEKFLESLSNDEEIKDWQIEQAETALHLYFLFLYRSALWSSACDLGAGSGCQPMPLS